jgi:hypothetical protein
VKIVSRWADLPIPLREHLRDRLNDRKITVSDLKKLQFWLASGPEVPEGEWFKDFSTFIVCGESQFIKTFLEAI